MDLDLATAGASELAAHLRAGRISSVELLEAYLERIDALDGDVNAVVTLDVERARDRAAAIDAARAAGRPDLGPLAGLPITVKDALETAGLRSTGGAAELANHLPEADAPAVGAVRDAGAVIFGKTNLPCWSGDVQSTNELFGTTVNPWDHTRTPGGSSGGAAAAVACGFTAFELGTDIGGSIRIPASFCGVWGHKPSWGLVPGLGYLDHPAGGTMEADVNVIGPLARSVDDLELVLDVISGPTPDRAGAWSVTLPAPRATRPEQFRVGAWLDDPACPVDPEVAEVMEAAVTALEAAGATVDRAARPPLDLTAISDLGLSLISVATTVELDDDTFDRLCSLEVERLDPARARAVEAVTQRHRDWLLGHRRRAEVRAHWAEFFRHHDVLLAPVSPAPAFRHLHGGNMANRTIDIAGVSRPYLDLIRWTCFVGVAYLPVTVPPIGRTRSGLPVGIQVIGPYLEDRTTLAFARILAEAAGCGTFVPPPAGGRAETSALSRLGEPAPS